ncbi:ribosome-inactivating family protein [Spiroplasma endosymbiont of Nephrotoma flavescens]|uniref:ribosome-inactivating family protein n=1 Tax=Spiroplasma endosymbiont of Nephrotoma flavescens TaxID=3066302 RepID=UPI00313F20E0
MKKLISLLSFLTISGATMPMVVAAAPYQQTNNLEVLSRVKITNNNIREIPTSSSELNINEEFSQVDFYNTITEIRNWLRNQNILLLTSTNSDGSTTTPYAINTDLQNNNNNFIIPVSFQNRRINLVFRSRDLYLQGYTMIGNNNNIYYHFNDSTTTNINGYTSWRLGFDGNYNSLLPSEEYIRWNDILASFNDLINYSEDTTTARSIRRSLGRIIILTAESLRFNSVQSLIDNNFRLEQERPERPIYWNPGSNEILNSSKEPNVNFIVTNWLTNSNLFYSNNIMNRDFKQNLGNQIAILVVSAGVQFLRDWCEKFPNSMPKKEIKEILMTTYYVLNMKNKD